MIKKDFTECKAWLQAQHPELFEELYGPAPEEKKAEAGKEGEDKKEEESKQKKPQKKKGPAGGAGGKEIRVVKTKRGAKKTICFIIGLQNYGVNLKEITKALSKKIGCGANVTNDDKYGECIQIQGDVEERLADFLDKDMA
jgi:density-regulated protein DRP1